jgi:FMN phosphatase YigB (HAD superfamily)
MTAMPIGAVLFDYHQTLFRFEGDEAWIDAAARACGTAMAPPERQALALRLDAARTLPEVLEMGEGRDLSTPAHCSFILGWLRLAGVPDLLAQALYDRLITPVCWYPYQDAQPVLKTLATHGVPVAVVSNTGWNLRETFAHHGLLQYVQAFALSCERGLQKPGPELFLAACLELGVPPRDTLMVGDNPTTDGGSVHAGIPAYLLGAEDGDGPRGLEPVLGLAGLPTPSSTIGVIQENGDTKPTR